MSEYEWTAIHRVMLKDKIRTEAFRRAIEKTVKPGDTVTLLIDGEVEPGYHVYGALEGIGIVPSLEIGKAAAAVLKTKGGFDVPPGETEIKYQSIQANCIQTSPFKPCYNNSLRIQ